MAKLKVSFSPREVCAKGPRILSSSAWRSCFQSSGCEGENKGVFGGVKVNHSVPSVSRLIFAYDLMIFGTREP